jgi:hypothetical protein
MRWKNGFLPIAILLVGCAEPQLAATGVTPCEEIVPGCTAERLPDVTLKGDQTRRPLGSVDGFSLDGLIGFDEALRRGAAEGGAYPSDTVQVTLGSADGGEQHWGDGERLFYAVDWEGGLCGVPAGGGLGRTPSSPTCIAVTAGTIIDARTGEFIVSGESSV